MEMTIDQITNASGLDGRNALRKYITNHDGWQRLRTDNGLDLGSLTMSGLKDCARSLLTGEPISAERLEALHNAAPKDAPKVIDGAVIDAPKPLVVDAPHNNGLEDDAATLARIFRDMANKGTKAIDEDAVKAIVDKAIKEALAEATNVVRVEIKRDNGIEKVNLGTVHKSFATVLRAAAARHPQSGQPIPIWLGGPAGAGKTSIARNLATALSIPYYHVKSMLFPQDLLGYYALGVWNSTPFVEAYMHGGVVILDEIDTGANEALLTLKGAMSNGHIMLQIGKDADGKHDGSLINVPRHPDCYILAAGNTWGLGATNDYIGRNKIDAAFLDEFLKVEVAYDESFERSISGNIDWACRVQKVRAQFKAKSVRVIISPRATLHGSALIAAGFTPDEAAKLTYLGGLTADQIKMLEG